MRVRTRRVVVVSGASLALAGPTLGRAGGDSAPNDARLHALVDEAVRLWGELNRIARVASRRWGDDPENTPLAGRDAATLARQDAVLDAMAATPADTPAGMDLKWRLYGWLSVPWPQPGDGGLYAALVRSAHADAARLGLSRPRP